MKSTTQKLWAKQDQHRGDRLRLFAAIADWTTPARVLYPGSFVDVAASFAFKSVTYVDSDRRAATFFGDRDGVAKLVEANQIDATERNAEFIAADYRSDLDLPRDRFDLLVSLYAGFVSKYCTQYLRIGGHLLVNPSHGDAALASIDPSYRLVAVVKSGGANGYRVVAKDLNSYFIPRRPQEITAERIHELGRGIGYTKSPFAYLFVRVQ